MHHRTPPRSRRLSPTYRMLVLTLAIIMTSLMWVQVRSVRAATITVSTTAELLSAVGSANPGDTINVNNGVYTLTSAVTMSRSGTSSAWITLQATPGHMPILDAQNLGSGGHCITILAQYITINGFTCRNAPQAGIVVWGGKDIRILNNTVHGNAYSGIFVGYNARNVVTNVHIEGNTAYDNATMNRARTLTGGWPAAIGVERASAVTIVNNRIYKNWGEGITNYLSDNVTASRNVLSDNYSVQLYFDNSTNSTYDGNFAYPTGDTNFYRFNAPAVGIQMANEYYDDSNPLNNNKILNNIIVGGRYGMFYGNYQRGGGLKNTVIANNTFYKATLSLLFIDPDSHVNTVIMNNIFAQAGGGTMTDYTAHSGISFRSNLWSGGSAGGAAGPGDISASPLLANAGGVTANDYQLTSGSPAIDTGTASSAPLRDYWRTSRPQGAAHDIGAHERGGTPTPTPTETPVPSSINLISNPGFELDWTGWTNWSNGSIDATGGRSGTKGLKVGTGTGGAGSTAVAAVGGTRYTLTAWARVSTSADTACWVGLKTKDRAGVETDLGTFNVASTAYTQGTKPVVTPTNAVSIFVYIWKNAGSGSCLMDDVRLIKE